MGVSLGKTGRSTLSRINITPMIDVLLVLLVIFMVAQQILVKALDVQLPRDAKADQPNPDVIVLEIEPGGVLRVNAHPVQRAGLGPLLTRLYAGRADKVLFVQASGKVKYREVIGALDAARGAGVKVIGAVLPRS